MTIKTRIIATLSLLFVLMLGISSYGPAVNMIQSASIDDALLEGKIAQIQHMMEKARGQLALALQHHPNFEFAVLHNHPVENHLKLVEENIVGVESRWNDYLSQIQDPAEKKLAEKWFNDTEALGKTHLTNAVNAVRKGDWDSAEHLLIGQVAKNYAASGIASNELSDYIADRLKKASAKAESQMYIANMALIIGIVLAFIVSIISAITLIRNIIPPLIEAIRITERISQGDLTHEVTVKNNNEIGRMLSAIRDMNESLRQIVGQVHTDADAIASATTQIAAGNLDLSSRTEEAAAALEETASSVEEMTQTVRMNTEKATQANTLANDASRIATEAGSVVSDVVDTMTLINDSSHRIVDIISVIDGIAFQTNILALNAAVEAARAGEQGRGFAVVATEVRSLAQRSASAAREIKELIDDSVEKVEHGSTLVNRAGDIMSRVVNSIQEVNALMGEISTASHEQADGIEQINIAVTQMDEATQQNAALVEEAAAAAQTLSENAENLKKMVGIFQLPGTRSTLDRNPPLALEYESMDS